MVRKLFFIGWTLSVTLLTNAQFSSSTDTTFSNSYYMNRMDLYEALPVKSHHIVFLGNSLTEQGRWNELFPDLPVIGRGIGGDNCWGVYNRLDQIINAQPAAVFLLIGINDLGRGLPIELIARRYRLIVEKILKEAPNTFLVLQTILPINEEFIHYDYLKNVNPAIKKLNEEIRRLADDFSLNIVDLHEVFSDEWGQLPMTVTQDGLHLNGLGYLRWAEVINDSGFLNLMN